MWPSAAAGGPLALRGRGGGRAEQGFCASGEVQLGTGRRLLPGQLARYPLLGGFRSELRRATTAGAAALSSHVSPGAAGTHVSGQTVLPAHLFPAWGWRA